jgi:hypothetical protein
MENSSSPPWLDPMLDGDDPEDRTVIAARCEDRQDTCMKCRINVPWRRRATSILELDGRPLAVCVDCADEWKCQQIANAIHKQEV